MGIYIDCNIFTVANSLASVLPYIYGVYNLNINGYIIINNLMGVFSFKPI
jgi:hypothetical protein